MFPLQDSLNAPATHTAASTHHVVLFVQRKGKIRANREDQIV